MYKAVGSPGSRLTRVTWMLEELGAPYEIVKAKPQSDLMFSFNPSGKAPALVDGDLVVTDSAAICIYLAEKHPEKEMTGEPGPAGRAAMNSWIHFAQSELEAALWNKLKHRMLLPQELRVDVGPATAYDFARDIKAMDARLLSARRKILGGRCLYRLSWQLGARRQIQDRVRTRQRLFRPRPVAPRAGARPRTRSCGLIGGGLDEHRSAARPGPHQPAPSQ